MTEPVSLQQDVIYCHSSCVCTAVSILGAWQATQRMWGVAVCGRIVPTFVEGSYPYWLGLRSPELCFVLYVPVMLAGPGYKEDTAWPEQSQRVFSAFRLWLAAVGSSVIAVDCNGRGASDDGWKTLCLEKNLTHNLLICPGGDWLSS